MIALDTNIIVRLLTGDDPKQVRVATSLLRAGTFFVAKTVLVETEWVLRYSCRLSAKVVNEAFLKLLGYPLLVFEQREAVVRAVTWHGAGMDFADAIHLASGSEAEAFATFDRALVTRGRAAQAPPPIKLLR